MSFNYVNDNLNAGGFFYGFRRAAIAEINELLSNAGIPLTVPPGPYSYSYDPEVIDNLRDFTQMLGRTLYWVNENHVIGTTQINSSGYVDVVGVGVLGSARIYRQDFGFLFPFWSPDSDADTASHQVGHWLVRPATVRVRLESLVDHVFDLNIAFGISNSLNSKLSAVSQALDDANEKNDVSAINKLQAFTNAVEAQRGKHIPDADADALIAAAVGIIDMLSLQ
jgi:hypothetical protein